MISVHFNTVNGEGDRNGTDSLWNQVPRKYDTLYFPEAIYKVVEVGWNEDGDAFLTIEQLPDQDKPQETDE